MQTYSISRILLNIGRFANARSAANHADFPQPSIFDEVFDNIEWESYRALGKQIGHKVSQPA
jgi:hypothetical protein